jgi:hypothetical protein
MNGKITLIPIPDQSVQNEKFLIPDKLCSNGHTQPTLVHTTLDVDFTLHIADKYLPLLVDPSSI